MRPRNPPALPAAATSLQRMSDPNDVPTKPLPVSAAAPTEPLASDITATAPVATTPAVTMPARRPSWIGPAILVAVFAVLLVLAVAIVPWMLADRADPVPSVTPTLEAPAPAPTEEAPAPAETEQAPVIPVPEPTDVLPDPEPTPEEPEPTPTP